MSDTHQPREEFVEKLEWQIGRELRQHNRSAQTFGWASRSRVKTVFGLLGLMLVSMGIGAVAAAAAYQAQGNQRRDLLTSSFEHRVELARQRLRLASEHLQATERQVSLGVENRESLLEGRIRVAEAQAQVSSLEIQIEEIRITGRDPLDQLSSPLAGGRDFLSERLRIEMVVPQTALELERVRLQEAEKRYSLGAADAGEVDVCRARIVEVEAALEAIERKLDFRRQFLKGQIDAAETELRVLDTEAAQRLKNLAAKLNLARNRSKAAAVKFQLGSGQRIDVAEAALRQQELQTEMAKAELDLALARNQLEQHRPKSSQPKQDPQ